MKKYNLIQEFRGYVNKADITNTDPRFLVSGSQNVIINDGEKVAKRAGYTIYGAANTALTPIVSSYDWLTSTGPERNLRKYDTKLEVYYSDAWRTVSSSFGASTELNFAEWWSSSEVKDFLLIVDGTADLKMWSGGITTFASATVNTITKQGSTTWAEERFLLAGTRSVVINGTTYAYTGGEGTTTLTGVTPDPTAGAHAVGSIVIQSLRTTSSLISSAVELDIITVHQNQVYVADSERRDVYVSKNTDYTNYSFTSPTRLPGEGAILTLDSPAIGFAVQENSVYISGTQKEWYQTKFTLSSDLTKETLTVDRLKTGPEQGALSQSAIGKIKNSVIFVSKELTVDTLGRVESIDTPESRPLSDIIKAELASYDTTIPPDIKYFKNNVYIAFPSEGKVLVYDLARKLWQPPQILPVRKFAIIDSELYGHSNSVPETYKLFDGTSDNTNPIDARAAFAYRTYGRPDWKKSFDEWFTEGYISSNCTLQVAHKYDFGGFTTINEREIDGDDETILFSTITDNSLGKYPFGSQPLGSITDSPDDLAKFRCVHDFQDVDFYEHQVLYQDNDIDTQWQLLRQGGNVELSKSENIDIKI